MHTQPTDFEWGGQCVVAVYCRCSDAPSGHYKISTVCLSTNLPMKKKTKNILAWRFSFPIHPGPISWIVLDIFYFYFSNASPIHTKWPSQTIDPIELNLIRKNVVFLIFVVHFFKINTNTQTQELYYWSTTGSESVHTRNCDKSYCISSRLLPIRRIWTTFSANAHTLDVMGKRSIGKLQLINIYENIRI